MNLRPSGCTCLLPSLSLRGRASSLWSPFRETWDFLQPLILKLFRSPKEAHSHVGKFQNSLQAVLNKGWPQALAGWLGGVGWCVSVGVGWGGGVVSMGGGQRCHRRVTEATLEPRGRRFP